MGKNKTIDSFFKDLNVKTKSSTIKLVIGESKYKDGQNIVGLANYEFNEVAFFRKNNTDHKCLTRILNLILGTGKSDSFLAFLKNENLHQEDAVNYFKDYHNIYFVNFFKSSNSYKKENTNINEINKFLKNHKSKMIDVLFVGEKAKKYFPMFNPEYTNVFAIAHPQRSTNAMWEQFDFEGDEVWNSSEAIIKYFRVLK
ncbi:MAG: hypothetical protein ACTIC0_10005 [Lactococcus lactis]